MKPAAMHETYPHPEIAFVYNITSDYVTAKVGSLKKNVDKAPIRNYKRYVTSDERSYWMSHGKRYYLDELNYIKY